MKMFDVLIVGAGAAGLSAASVAASQGLSVALIDDNAAPGGQFFRQLPAEFRRAGKTAFDKDERGPALYAVVKHPSVTYLPRTVAWHMPAEGTIAVAGEAFSDHLQARLIVIAAGAYDRPVPFPGWTLPGVVTAGGLQNLIKGQRVIPGRRAVVVGNGPLVLLTAASLARAGAQLVAVAEAAPAAGRLLSHLAGLASAPDIVRQAIGYSAAIARSGAARFFGWTVIEARGEGEVAEVALAPIDASGTLDRGRSRTFRADLLVSAFGLLPSIELLRLCGADMTWNALRGGWLPERSSDFETSRPGVFAIGDGSAIGGVELALVEGRLMGLIAARRLGRAPDGPSSRQGDADRARLARLHRFRGALEELYRPPRSFLGLATPETVVCRCEEVTMSGLAELGAQGIAGISALKSTTRAGMGRCQGRNCMPTLVQLAARAGSLAPEQVPLPNARPPARPVLLKDMLRTPTPPLGPPDPATAHLPRGERVG